MEMFNKGAILGVRNLYITVSVSVICLRFKSGTVHNFHEVGLFESFCMVETSCGLPHKLLSHNITKQEVYL